MIFSVWAPFAKSVDIVVEDGAVPMLRQSDDHWYIELDESRVAAGYRYSVDDGPALPDPRSRWQPDGVHGASRIVNTRDWHAAAVPGFRPRPLTEAVIYELHVGTFTPEGTYAGAAKMLPYLVELGITHVELMPVATFPGGRGWGYDGVHLFAPFPSYGTPEELAVFVDACHSHGLAALLDVVYNHLGPEGNYLAAFGPYFSDRVRTNWGLALNYDGPYSDPVRQFVVDNALMWLREYGFDGLRLDAVHAIFGFEALHLLEELSKAVKRLGRQLGRELLLIAESDLNDPRLIRGTELGGYGLDAHWADDLHHGIHRFLTGESTGYYSDFNGLADIATALREGYVYQGQYSAHRRRRHGRPPRGISLDQLVVSSQNHDQVGNRAVGDRLSASLSVTQLKAAAALIVLSPCLPMLFQGEEWAASTPFLYFTDFLDEQLGKTVSQGRRAEFTAFNWQQEVPDPQLPETFMRSKLNWAEIREAPHADMLNWYRALIALRRVKAHWTGSRRPEVDVDPDALWLRVVHAGVLAQFNFAAYPQTVPLPPGSWRLALCSTQAEGNSELEPLAAGATWVLTARKS
jgi:maltooligosyltrehalose trehalohydrolase